MAERDAGRDAYRAIAEELRPGVTVRDLDPAAVELAREYAKRSHQKWPPHPVVTGWVVQVTSIERGPTWPRTS